MRIFAGDLLVSGSLGDQRGNMSGSNSSSSPPVSLRHIQGYSAHAVIAASSLGVTGTFKLQGSNDPATTNHTNPTNRVVNFVDISGSSQSINVPSGSAGNVMWNVGGAYYSWVRVVYTGTSGSGSMDLRVTGKGPQ